MLSFVTITAYKKDKKKENMSSSVSGSSNTGIAKDIEIFLF